MTPALVFLFGLSQSSAAGSYVAAASHTVHGTARHIGWGVIFRPAAGSLPASIAIVLHATARTRVDPLILHALAACFLLRLSGSCSGIG
jgi:hypothetical protein